MRLVTDASPLIFLAKIDGLALLEGCFLEVLAPPAVVEEARLRLPDFIRRAELSELGEGHISTMLPGLAPRAGGAVPALATPLPWRLRAVGRWLCVPAFRRVCPQN